MYSAWSFIQRYYKVHSPPAATPSENAVKFGILGAANIAPSAIIHPCMSHSEAAVYAVAARNEAKAVAYAKKWGIVKVYGGEGSYQKLLDDPNVDAVYVALPNGLHYEWAARALKAGKHVLLEKPSTNTLEETRALFKLAESENLILLEAFHYRFHPAAARFKEIIQSKELGEIKSIEASSALPRFVFSKDDIRYKYELGGGALMDMGCYCIDAIRFFTSLDPIKVLDVKHTASHNPNVDRGTTASFALPNDIIASITCDLALPNEFGFMPASPQVSVKVDCEGGKLEFDNFVTPTYIHDLTITPRGGEKRVENIYTWKDGVKGEDWWSTHRYQLEEFVNKIKGRKVRVWIDADESEEDIKWIEKVYRVGGYGSRPKSAYVL